MFIRSIRLIRVPVLFMYTFWNLADIIVILRTTQNFKGLKSMCKRYWATLLLAGCFILSFNCITAQPSISYLGIDQGLPNNSVRTIFKDSKGFMWFGTYDGLCRYDGYEFKVFRNKIQDSNSLIHNWVMFINEDYKHNLWIGTRQGSCVYNKLSGKFTALTYNAATAPASKIVVNDVTRGMNADAFNNMLIGYENMGLLFFKNSQVTGTRIAVAGKGGATYDFSVQSIVVDKDKKTWVFVQNKGLCYLDYKLLKLQLVDTTLQSITSMVCDNNNIWIVGKAGLYQYDIASNNNIKIVGTEQKSVLTGNPIGVFLDKEYKLWIGTYGGGINIWDIQAHKMEYLTAGDNKYTLSSNVVATVYEDKDSRKWIGTLGGGIDIIDPEKNKFQLIAHEPLNTNSLSGNLITCFYEDADNNLWVGTDGFGLNFWNRKENIFKRYKNIVPEDKGGNIITNVKGDHNNNIWVISFSNGVSKLNKVTQQFEQYKCINPVTGIENRVAYAMLEDRDKNFWVSTLRVGNAYGALYKFNQAANKFDLVDAGLSDLFVLKEDAQGIIWGGDLAHLIQIDKVNNRHRFYTINYPVRAITEDRAGNFWVGTEGGGLLLFDRKQFNIIARYTTDDGLSSNSALNIIEDDDNNLWISTPNGISAFNVQTKKIKNYYQADGLQSNQFLYNAAAKLQTGELIFGGIKGFNIFNPENIKPANRQPTLTFTGIRVGNQPYGDNNLYDIKSDKEDIVAISIPYNKADFSFDFAALEYSVPGKILYSYYMEGWDRGWTNTGNIRTANYSHLKEGNYTFRVKSTDADGVWNNKEIQLKIRVLPPLYRTWWAYTGYVAVTVLLIYLFWLYRTRQTRLKYEIKIAKLNIEKERAEHETERIVNEKEKEANEKRINFFTNITHEFRTPLTLIINPVKDLIQNDAGEKPVKEELGIVYRNARRMLSLVDQLLLFRKADTSLDTVKPSRLNFYQLCNEVFLCFIQQAKARNITYEFICSNQELELYVDREKMEIILFNLLSNAIKYTPDNGRVILSIEEHSETVAIKVSDTGSGIPIAAGTKLFEKFYKAEGPGILSKPGFGIGLFLVKQFTEAHKGNITYESTPGKGATFLLELKKGAAHFDPAIIVEHTAENYTLLQEIADDNNPVKNQENAPVETRSIESLITEKQSVLIVDDDAEIRTYIAQIFMDNFIIYEAATGEDGIASAHEFQPDIIISDIKMQGLSGIDLCKDIKSDPVLKHIPVILLTGTSSEELKLEGIKGGADDYITKPFDKEILMARVDNLLKNRNNLQQYFYNEITLNKQTLKISAQHKEFIEKCINVVEQHLDDDDFNIKTLASEMGMSHSVVYRKIKAISGQSLNGFIRFIRLRKAARLFIDTNQNVNEVATEVGIYDSKYFRENFNKVFGMNPSEYIKKYRKSFSGKFNVTKEGLEGNDNPET